MDFYTLSSKLKSHKMYLFTLKDVKNLFPKAKLKTIKNNFTRWLSKGYFFRLKRDVYEIVEQPELKIPDLYVANKLYIPSYISLETALSIYGMIPDVAANVTSVTTRPTRTFKNKYGCFFYKTCQKRAFVGYMVFLYEGFKVLFADKEKALVDFFYYRLREGFSVDFAEERLNKKILKKIDWKKTVRYAKLFNNKTVITVKKCKEYVNVNS